jgi:hypothetical protein
MDKCLTSITESNNTSFQNKIALSFGGDHVRDVCQLRESLAELIVTFFQSIFQYEKCVVSLVLELECR